MVKQRKYRSKHTAQLNLSVPIELKNELYRTVPEGVSVSEVCTRILAKELGVEI